MIDDQFRIYVDRLSDGRVEEIDQSFDPVFMGIDEKELAFPEQVKIKGKAYVSDGRLILSLRVQTKAHLPCSVCNQFTTVPLVINDFIHTQEIATIKGNVFDVSKVLREAVLLELPLTAECQGGACPQREELKDYLLKPKGTYSPFEEL